MKKLTVILIISAFAFHANAEQLNTVELINLLMQVKAIIKYKTFRKYFEKTIVKLGKIDNMQGSIHERINAVFVNNIILEKNAGVITNSNKITFDAAKAIRLFYL